MPIHGQDQGSQNQGSKQPRKVSDVTPQEDPYVWLEDVTGEKSLAWVRQRNELTQKKYETPEFNTLKDDLLKILDSDERIPAVGKDGPYYYNSGATSNTSVAFGVGQRWKSTARPSPIGNWSWISIN